jgi:hypothetical protein
MEPYLFHGIVLPERAQIARLQFGVGFEHLESGIRSQAKVSIILNQVIVWVDGEHDWNIFDLRNVVQNIVQSTLAMAGYLLGYAYDFEVTRVLNQSRGIDYVFGIDIPCLAQRPKPEDMNEALMRLREKASGLNGILISRCFSDLVSAMKHPEDTGFHCYRAIESLRHHCAAQNGLASASRKTQWQKFHEVSGCSEETVRRIGNSAATALRHGEPAATSEDERVALFTGTWDIVDAYLARVPQQASA